MNIKSERLKKLESELQDLEQWLRLGLVPKKDLEKHKDEMRLLNDRIDEEKERLRFLKESGELEEFSVPKRPAHGRQAVEPHSLPDIDIAEEGLTDAGLDMETESFDIETTASGEEGEEGEEEGTQAEEEEEDDPFSDRNRWRRGILEDPDANDW
ncbi:MAG: hypothetical protein KF898_11005 [Parachlamydiales bacterium]|jgi:hypothetical protein|nr:hypothetical protein [Candidatus Acheromyda pituitae]